MQNQQSDPATTKRNVTIGVILFAIFSVVVIIIALITTISRIGKIPIKVQYAPATATITVGDVSAKNNSTIYLAPDDYHLTASAPDFNEYSSEIYIDNEVTLIFGQLSPANDAGREYQSAHLNDFLAIEGIAGKLASTVGERQRAANPLLNSLPYKNSLFTIGYKMNSGSTTFGDTDRLPAVTTDYTYIISSPITYISGALYRLSQFDIGDHSLAEYDIIFDKFTNPFEGKFQTNSATDPTDFIRRGFTGVDFAINPSQYTSNNQYYYTTITTGSADNYTLVTYHILLERSGDSWHLVSTPYPILTTHNTPDVPLDLLDTINDL